MRYLNPEAVRAALPMVEAIDAMVHAFSGDREAPNRMLLGVSLFMPGRLDDHTGVKVVSSVPGDPAGIVAVFDQTGQTLGLVDGPTLSAIRTAAAPGLATDRMAAPDAAVLAMLESFLGVDVFQQGVRRYLRDHALQRAGGRRAVAAVGISRGAGFVVLEALREALTELEKG